MQTSDIAKINSLIGDLTKNMNSGGVAGAADVKQLFSKRATDMSRTTRASNMSGKQVGKS